jgi:hypothetical protein
MTLNEEFYAQRREAVKAKIEADADRYSLG